MSRLADTLNLIHFDVIDFIDDPYWIVKVKSLIHIVFALFKLMIQVDK